MYNTSKNKGNPYAIFTMIALVLALMVSSFTLDNLISSCFFLFSSSFVIGLIVGIAVIYIYKDPIFNDYENEPFFTCIFIILGFCFTTFCAETFLNRYFELKPPEKHEVEILSAREWVSVSRTSKGGTTRSYHAKITLKGWEGLNKDSITLNIKYGTANLYKEGYYASILVRTGLLNIKYVSKYEIEPTYKSVYEQKIVKSEELDTIYKEKINAPKYYSRNIGSIKATETEEERIKRVFYDPKSPDFGKKKLPKEIYLSLNDKDKKRYKYIRKKIFDNKKESQQSKTKLMGY